MIAERGNALRMQSRWLLDELDVPKDTHRPRSCVGGWLLSERRSILLRNEFPEESVVMGRLAVLLGLALVCACTPEADGDTPGSGSPPSPSPPASAKLDSATGQPTTDDAAISLKGKVLDWTDASERYDFRISLESDCEEPEESSCPRQASIAVLEKGRAEPFQTIALDEVWMEFDEQRQPVASSKPDEYERTIEIADFDFDGAEDLAIHANNDGFYGLPTYSVFLFRAATGSFVYNKELSKLTHGLGLFRTDAENRRLTAYYKSGCCDHWSHTYEMRGARPMLVARWHEILTKRNGWVETRQRLVNGHWQTSIKTRPDEPEPE